MTREDLIRHLSELGSARTTVGDIRAKGLEMHRLTGRGLPINEIEDRIKPHAERASRASEAILAGYDELVAAAGPRVLLPPLVSIAESLEAVVRWLEREEERHA